MPLIRCGTKTMLAGTAAFPMIHRSSGGRRVTRFGSEPFEKPALSEFLPFPLSPSKLKRREIPQPSFPQPSFGVGPAVSAFIWLPDDSYRANDYIDVTFCASIKVREGIIALADTRIVRGNEQVNKQKLAEFVHDDQSLFTMTSGLRSVRDKTVTYVDEALRSGELSIDRLYQFANLYGDQLRRVKVEDGPSLAATNHTFNLNSIIGGRLNADLEPQLFYVYPEGNWVECAYDSPYFIIGRTYYGKPILDRLLTYETPLPSAIALAFLAFDATRASVTDVGYPIDIAVLATNAHHTQYRRLNESDLSQASQWWTKTLSDSIVNMPMQWASGLI